MLQNIHYNNELNNGMLPIVQPLGINNWQGFEIRDGRLEKQKDLAHCWSFALRSIKIGSTNCSTAWMISGLRFGMKT